MSALLSNLDQQHPGYFSAILPASLNSTGTSLSGTLYLGKNGYVYDSFSKPVIWLKFTGLAIYLPIWGVVQKCREVVSQILGKSHQPFVDSNRLFSLAQIAWKAVLGLSSLEDCIEEFSLKELMNHKKHASYIEEAPRSYRLYHGSYAAPCMQPLFSRASYISSHLIESQTQELRKEKNELEDFLNDRRHWLKHARSQHKGKSVEQLHDELARCSSEIRRLEGQLDFSKRCEKYAAMAIANQYCCVEYIQPVPIVEKGWSCCRYEKTGACVHRVECCAIRCWAIHCCGSVCCFSPDLGVCMV